MRPPILAVFFSASILILAAVAAGQNLLYWPDSTWRPPDGMAAKPNPLAGNPQATSGGRKLFLRNCAECHNKNGTGVRKKHAADLQLPIVQQQSDGVLFWKITNGNTGRGMPSFTKLPERERWQLVLFLRTLTLLEKQN
jgi:mono/diheme cytochrome c family protein